jgi:hypothetical protein
MAALAEWKQAFVFFMWEWTGRSTLPLHPCEREQSCEEDQDEPLHFGSRVDVVRPASVPAVHSSRNDNRRWLQSGAGAPLVR